MDKLLIISGPTATGKTDLAIKLAKKFNGELINADSRQLYQGMDIGTGKDHPKDIKISLIDIINPNQLFSVAEYQRLAKKEIDRIHGENKLPILVGGSGQYIDSVINPQVTFVIRPNKFLRFIISKFSVSLLQRTLKLLDNKTFSTLNNSDKNNPHRLIRKIEIKLSGKSPLSKGDFEGFDYLHISLTAPNSFLFKKIDYRINKRLEMGLLDEINQLSSVYSWNSPGLKTIAYKEFKPGIKNSLEIWKTNEHNLVRRQKTWFKKRDKIIFVDVSQGDILAEVSDIVKKWYNKP